MLSYPQSAQCCDVIMSCAKLIVRYVLRLMFIICYFFFPSPSLYALAWTTAGLLLCAQVTIPKNYS